MRRLLLLLPLVFLPGSWLTSRADSGALPPALPQSLAESFSFENDMQGWTAKGTDLHWAFGQFIPWSIERSQEMATDGNTSLKVYLDNENDSGKIWVERPFVVEPNQLYQATVEYDLASL